ncbi:MAG: hypothetical protein H7258_05365 [Ferruginibacter sp.]|nr:hypothetical protein [Ferruginibacter sp.]
MANFNISKDITIEFEGGFFNDRSAGWTYRGITEKFYPSWPGFARIRKLTGGKTPARYKIFKDAILDAYVDEFHNSVFWKNKVTGESIANQAIANMCYDFILHKENDAIKVINNVAKVFNPYITTKQTSLSLDVVKEMNKNPLEFYASLRNARLAYYNNSRNFSKPLKASFVRRVNKLPSSIGGVRGFLNY